MSLLQAIVERLPGSWQVKAGQGFAMAATEAAKLPACGVQREFEERCIPGPAGTAGRAVKCMKDAANAYAWEDSGQAALDARYVNVTGDTIQSILTGGDLSIDHFSANTAGAVLNLDVSRNTTPGSHTIVANGDIIGEIHFRGSNGTAFKDAAVIQVYVDGAPGAGNDMPGALSLQVTPDGSAVPVERIFISQSGVVTLSNLAGVGSRAISAGATGALTATTPLDNLSDVVITSVKTGDGLVYNGTTYVNGPGHDGPMGKPFTISDDFIAGSYANLSTSVGELQWVHTGTNAGLQQNGTTGRPGVARLFYSAINGSNSLLLLSGSLALIWNDIVEQEWIFSIDTAFQTFNLGLTDNSATFANSVLLSANTATFANRFFAHKLVGGVATTVDTGLLPVLGGVYRARLTKTAALECTITVDRLDAAGTGSAVITSVYSSVMIPVVRSANNGTGGVIIQGVGVDRFRMTVNPQRF